MYHVIRNYQKVNTTVVEAFRGIGTATVHEAYNRQGATHSYIKPIFPGMRICGTALTVKLHPGDNLMLHKAMDILQPGEVIVCDNAGHEEGPWGELLSISALARGCAGLVIDGYVRDGEAIQERGFSVFERGLSIKGTVKESLGLINHPISCAGVIVYPGDLVLGDADGVCVVERARAEEILHLSRERDQKELVQAKLLREGKTIWQLSNFDELARSKGLLEEPLEQTR